jgi:predicted  nucleic acid-binding Zn-ribbon protein
MSIQHYQSLSLFKEKELKQVNEDCESLYKERDTLSEKIARLRDDLNHESDSSNRIKLERDIKRDEDRKYEIGTELKKLVAEIEDLKQEINNKQDSETTEATRGNASNFF